MDSHIFPFIAIVFFFSLFTVLKLELYCANTETIYAEWYIAESSSFRVK